MGFFQQLLYINCFGTLHNDVYNFTVVYQLNEVFNIFLIVDSPSTLRRERSIYCALRKVKEMAADATNL